MADKKVQTAYFWKCTETGHIVNLQAVDGLTPVIQKDEKNALSYYFQVFANGTVITVGYESKEKMDAAYQDFIDWSCMDDCLVNYDSAEPEDEDTDPITPMEKMKQFEGKQVWCVKLGKKGIIEKWEPIRNEFFVTCKTEHGSVSGWRKPADLQMMDDQQRTKKKTLGDEFDDARQEWENDSKNSDAEASETPEPIATEEPIIPAS